MLPLLQQSNREFWGLCPWAVIYCDLKMDCDFPRFTGQNFSNGPTQPQGAKQEEHCYTVQVSIYIAPKIPLCVEGDWSQRCYVHQWTHVLTSPVAECAVWMWGLVRRGGPLEVWPKDTSLPAPPSLLLGCHELRSFLRPFPSPCHFYLRAIWPWPETVSQKQTSPFKL